MFLRTVALGHSAFVAASISLLLVACGGDGETGGNDDGDVTTGGTSSGGAASGGTDGSGGSTGAAPGTGGTGAGTSTLDELLTDAEEGCATLDMDVWVRFAEDGYRAHLDGRVVDGSLEMEAGDEVVVQESIAGDIVRLQYTAGVADGDQVAMSGWVEQARQDDPNRYRCFEGQVIVRKDYFGALYFIFASETIYEATADGTCGAPTTDEVAYGCLPVDY